MKRVLTIASLLALVAAPGASAQQKTLAATMDVHVFPAEGQTSEQQSKDEAECYNWAVGNTGTDPFDLAKQAEQQATQAQQQQEQAKNAGKGSGAQGAVGGAAAGALIGAIAGDTGKGAAYGAAAGIIAGRRSGRRQNAEAQAQAQQQAQQGKQATQGQLDNFKKAFSVCLEAKQYMVKF